MADDTVRIYERPPLHCEHPDHYREGHWAPIYLGDVLNNRYKVFRKLGYGSFSTVWLAHDQSKGGYVAVKVHSADAGSRAWTEVHHPNVESVLDHFTLESTNGSHLCTVLEPLGRSLRDVYREWLHVKPRDYEIWPSDDDDSSSEDDTDSSIKSDISSSSVNDIGSSSVNNTGSPSEDDTDTSGDSDRYNPHEWPTKLSREICRQILLGLDALHSQGIAHRDLYPLNISFALSYPIDSLSMDEIQRDGTWNEENASQPECDNDWDTKNFRSSECHMNRPIVRYDGKPLQAHEIQYTICPSDLHDRIVFDDLPSFRIVLIDLGSSQRFEDCDQPLVQNPNYRPPEYILPIPVTYKADIFTAGIMFYELVVTRNIVWAAYIHNPSAQVSTVDNYAYLKDLERRIGPMPEAYEAALPPKQPDDEELELDEFAAGDMRFSARRDGPKDMTDDELDAFIDLLKQMMQWEPEKRATTQELLKHRFFEPAYN